MTFIIKDQSCFDPSFVSVAKKLGELQATYTQSREKALRTRMEMIGLAEEEKSKHPQRSPEAAYIQEGYKENGWTEDVIKKNKAAWQQYQSFLQNVNHEMHAIAERSSVSQLYELSLDRNGSMWWDAMKYLQQHQAMPSVKQLRGYRGGYTDKRFNFRRQSSSIQEVAAPQGLQPGRAPQSVTTEAVKPQPTLPASEYLSPFPISTKAYDLALMLQGVVDQLLDIHPQWKGDHRITELVDARRLSELTSQLCAGRDLGWDF